jgi:hypothetical protein
MEGSDIVWRDLAIGEYAEDIWIENLKKSFMRLFRLGFRLAWSDVKAFESAVF